MSRINLSVAIVAMVVPLNQSESRTLTGSCPAHKNSANGTEVNQNGGTFDWDPKLQGVILGAFFYPYAILQIPQGRLAEKLGAKWTIAVSLLGSAVVNLVTPLVAHSAAMLIVTRVLLGAVQSGIFPASFAALREWFPQKERSMAFAVSEAGLASGVVLGSALSGYLTEYGFAGGWPSAFYVCGIMALVTLMLWLWFGHSSPAESPYVKATELEYITENGSSIESVMSPISRQVYLGKYLHVEIACIHRRGLQVGTTMNGAIIAAIWLSSATGGLMSGYLSERLIQMGWLGRTAGRKLFQCTGNLGGALLMCLIPSANCNIGFLVGLFVTANFLFGFYPGGVVPLSGEMSNNFAVTLYASMNTIALVASFITPYIVGVILQSGLSDDIRVLWSYIFYLSAAVTASGGIFFLIFAEADRQPWDMDMKEKDGRKLGN
ncbi:Sialin [Halotydeus destructor]|nr:Sialin [Halotydeus destructor]